MTPQLKKLLALLGPGGPACECGHTDRLTLRGTYPVHKPKGRDWEGGPRCPRSGTEADVIAWARVAMAERDAYATRCRERAAKDLADAAKADSDVERATALLDVIAAESPGARFGGAL